MSYQHTRKEITSDDTGTTIREASITGQLPASGQGLSTGGQPASGQGLAPSGQLHSTGQGLSARSQHQSTGGQGPSASSQLHSTGSQGLSAGSQLPSSQLHSSGGQGLSSGGQLPQSTSGQGLSSSGQHSTSGRLPSATGEAAIAQSISVPVKETTTTTTRTTIIPPQPQAPTQQQPLQPPSSSSTTTNPFRASQEQDTTRPAPGTTEIAAERVGIAAGNVVGAGIQGARGFVSELEAAAEQIAHTGASYMPTGKGVREKVGRVMDYLPGKKRGEQEIGEGEGVDTSHPDVKEDTSALRGVNKESAHLSSEAAKKSTTQAQLGTQCEKENKASHIPAPGEKEYMHPSAGGKASLTQGIGRQHQQEKEKEGAHIPGPGAEEYGTTGIPSAHSGLEHPGTTSSVRSSGTRAGDAGPKDHAAMGGIHGQQHTGVGGIHGTQQHTGVGGIHDKDFAATGGIHGTQQHTSDTSGLGLGAKGTRAGDVGVHKSARDVEGIRGSNVGVGGHEHAEHAAHVADTSRLGESKGTGSQTSGKMTGMTGIRVEAMPPGSKTHEDVRHKDFKDTLTGRGGGGYAAQKTSRDVEGVGVRGGEQRAEDVLGLGTGTRAGDAGTHKTSHVRGSQQQGGISGFGGTGTHAGDAGVHKTSQDLEGIRGGGQQHTGDTSLHSGARSADVSGATAHLGVPGQKHVSESASQRPNIRSEAHPHDSGWDYTTRTTSSVKNTNVLGEEELEPSARGGAHPFGEMGSRGLGGVGERVGGIGIGADQGQGLGVGGISGQQSGPGAGAFGAGGSGPTGVESISAGTGVSGVTGGMERLDLRGARGAGAGGMGKFEVDQPHRAEEMKKKEKEKARLREREEKEGYYRIPGKN